ncbi:MAG: EAL domain-containing protein [Pseudomonadota bacterium]
MSFPGKSAEGLGIGMHGRYLAGLVGLALLSTLMLLMEQRASSRSHHSGHIIGVAGEQVALSQRTAMLAFVLMTRSDRQDFERVRGKLSDAMADFRANHQYLRDLALHDQTRLALSPRAANLLSQPPIHLDALVDRYLTGLQRFRDMRFEDRSLDIVMGTSEQFLPLDPNPAQMAEALKALSLILEQDAEQQSRSIGLLNAAAFAAELALLALLGGFLFRPLVNRFIGEHQELEASYRELSAVVERQREADEARAEVEQRFEQAFHNAPIGMGLIDQQMVVYDANPALAQMLHLKRTGSCGQFTSFLHPESRDAFETYFGELVRGERDRISEVFACERTDGVALMAMINLSAVRRANHEFAYAVLQTRDVTESHRLQRRLERQASVDELTELPNRRAFEERFAQVWQDRKEGADTSFLLFMDLDQFKVVNDTSGHAAGDDLLRDIARILTECVRKNDVVCRLGGDEFAIILERCAAETAAVIAESIRASVDEFRFEWLTQVYRVGVSVGGVPIDPELGSVDDIRQIADAACYAAKEGGRNQVHLVTESEDTVRTHRRQVRWVQRLRDAIEHNQFAIYSQSIVPLKPQPNEPDRVEVLIRLRDTENRTLIPPGAFLPAAERYGLGHEIDHWVANHLLDALYVYSMVDAAPRRYWVNLSGTSIGDERFAEKIKAAVGRSPLPPGTINFEVTETAVIRNLSAAGRLMNELRDMGCQFALDDFGSGLSSFGYLKKLKVEYLKIDGMFTREILTSKTDQIFVRSIIDIAHSMGIKTVTEYVENEEILNLVRELGSDYAQGYGVARPIPLVPNFQSRPSDLEPQEIT